MLVVREREGGREEGMGVVTIGTIKNLLYVGAGVKVQTLYLHTH